MLLDAFRITRFQFLRDRVIGDSQVCAHEVNVAALELISDRGQVGLGFIQSLFAPLADQSEIERSFKNDVWPQLEGARPIALANRVTRPRGGNHRAGASLFDEAVQVALWDLAAKQANLPLHAMLGSQKSRVKAYASGLDYHLDDDAFCALFGHADALGYSAFKIKVGHPDFERDLHRLNLLSKTVRSDAKIMIDANEAWGAKEAAMKIEAIRAAGHDLLWVEDPILRSDFSGLRMLRGSLPYTQINSGEYMDASGKRALMQADAADIINVHGQITDVMRVGWLAAEMGVPVSVGNTFLEVGIHPALALPEVEWMEYSFQNFDHLIDEPVKIADGYAYAPKGPGHGLNLSNSAREQAQPLIKTSEELGPAPQNIRLAVTPERSLET